MKPRSPALRADSLPAEPQGKPKNTGMVAYPFSSGSSWPRNRTGISCIAGRFFINWAMRKVQERRVSSFYSHIPIWWKDLKPNFYQVIWGEGRTQEDMKIKRKTELDVSPESQAVPKIWTIGVYWFWVKGSIVNVIQLLFSSAPFSSLCLLYSSPSTLCLSFLYVLPSA